MFFVLYYTVLYCTVLQCIVFRSILQYMLWHCLVLLYCVLYCIVSIVLYCIVCTVVYFNVLCLHGKHPPDSIKLLPHYLSLVFQSPFIFFLYIVSRQQFSLLFSLRFQGPRSRGGRGGHVPPNIFKIIKS